MKQLDAWLENAFGRLSEGPFKRPLETGSHVEVTTSPGDRNGMVKGRERKGHDHGIKTDRALNYFWC